MDVMRPALRGLQIDLKNWFPDEGTSSVLVEDKNTHQYCGKKSALRPEHTLWTHTRNFDVQNKWYQRNDLVRDLKLRFVAECCAALKRKGKTVNMGTHQKSRGDRNDVGHRVLGADMLAGFGNVAKDAAVDNGSKDEVNMTNQDKNQTLFHEPPRPFIFIWVTKTQAIWFL